MGTVFGSDSTLTLLCCHGRFPYISLGDGGRYEARGCKCSAKTKTFDAHETGKGFDPPGRLGSGLLCEQGFQFCQLVRLAIIRQDRRTCGHDGVAALELVFVFRVKGFVRGSEKLKAPSLFVRRLGEWESYDLVSRD